MSDVTAEPMHIIETYFECCGFDHTFLQGGTSVYLWNLSRAFARRGHRVSVVTPAHGRLDDLRSRHVVEDLDYDDRYTLPLVLDPDVWQGFPAEVPLELRTTAHRIRLEDVDLYFLSNEYLDRLPDTFYPPYSAKGNDLTFFKPLVFQVDSVRFLQNWFADERAVVHAHEPFYHYLLPPALSMTRARAWSAPCRATCRSRRRCTAPRSAGSSRCWVPRRCRTRPGRCRRVSARRSGSTRSGPISTTSTRPAISPCTT